VAIVAAAHCKGSNSPSTMLTAAVTATAALAGPTRHAVAATSSGLTARRPAPCPVLMKKAVTLSQSSHRLGVQHRTHADGLDTPDADLQLRIRLDWPDRPRWSTDQKAGPRVPPSAPPSAQVSAMFSEIAKELNARLWARRPNA
jgi:hypothetical protein